MKRLLFVVAVLALSSTATMAALQWDFETGMQGWTWNTTGSGTWVPGQYIGPGDPPPLLVTGGLGDVYGVSGGNLYLPGDANSRSAAVFDLSGLLIGGKTNKFLLRADVYIPNLRPYGGFPNNYPGMMNQYAGIWMLAAGTNWGVGIYGKPQKGSQCYLDFTADDNWPERRKDWYMEDWTGGSYLEPDSLWWNRWITLELDWNYSSPGNVIARYYQDWPAYNGATGWITLYSGAIYPNSWGATLRDFSRIVIGCNVNSAGTPWTKSQFDNVYFDSPDLIPEPGSILALSAGLIGLAGLARRRRS